MDARVPDWGAGSILRGHVGTVFCKDRALASEARGEHRAGPLARSGDAQPLHSTRGLGWWGANWCARRGGSCAIHVALAVGTAAIDVQRTIRPRGAGFFRACPRSRGGAASALGSPDARHPVEQSASRHRLRRQEPELGLGQESPGGAIRAARPILAGCTHKGRRPPYGAWRGSVLAGCTHVRRVTERRRGTQHAHVSDEREGWTWRVNGMPLGCTSCGGILNPFHTPEHL